MHNTTKRTVDKHARATTTKPAHIHPRAGIHTMSATMNEPTAITKNDTTYTGDAYGCGHHT